MNEETVKVKAVLDWKLEKFDGDPPTFEGEKEPVEIITGGDDKPTRRFMRNVETNLLEEVNHGNS